MSQLPSGSMNPHTPGPWEVVEYNEGRNMDIQDSKGNGVLTKKNARLIAAAPDLLVALEGVLAIGNLTQALGSYSAVAIAEARAAIAKAKGEGGPQDETFNRGNFGSQP